MDPYLEIAVPTHTKAVTFFVGTGFSKYLTDGEAPSWLELLVDLTKKIDSRRNTLRDKLFYVSSRGRVLKANFELSICAQMVELEYRKQKKDFRETVVEIISTRISNASVNTRKIRKVRDFFKKYPGINFVTTNYDTLLSDQVLAPLKQYPRIIVDGSPIPKINTGQNIYHIHGCIIRPSSIVITINDYFRFQHEDNYFSRKLSTLLHENTIVVLGYSLGDFNLNRIFNEAQISKAVSLRRNDMYLVSREEVDDIYEDFYSYSYGINVIDGTEIDEFLERLDEKMSEAKDLVTEAKNLEQVINGAEIYTDDFIKLETSFSQIILQANTIGISSTDERMQELLIDTLKRKKGFTTETGAWNQYAHLADWLIEFGIITDMTKRNTRSEFLKLVKYSFSKMSKDNLLGLSWAAYRTWESRFQEMKIENQELISHFVKQNMAGDADAMAVIR